MKHNDMDKYRLLLERIRDDQRLMIEQQQKILSELAEVKTRQKRLQQEMEGELAPLDMLSTRNGLLQ